MSENTFIALLGIVGTLIAGILGTIGGFGGSFFLQWIQRKWAIEDRRREWKKEYREKQVEPLQILVRTWLNNPNDFHHKTEQGFAIDLPRGSAWGISDERLRNNLLDFMEKIGKYYHVVRTGSPADTKILNTEISPLCAPLEIDLERYISAS